MGQGAAVAAQGGSALQPLHVVHSLGARLRHGHKLALLLHHLFHLTAQSVHPRLQVRLLGSGQTLQRGVHPLKQPRVAQCAPGDHHAVAVCLPYHAQRVLGAVDIAVAQHWHLYRILYPGDDLRVDARGVHLLPGAGVHRHQRRARLLAGFGALHGGDVVGVPALAHFYGDRALGVRHHLLHDAPAAVGVQHQLAARPAGNDLRGRAAHVDVHKVKFVLLNGGGGLAHDLRHFAEDLHPIGCAVGRCLQQADSLMVAIHQRPAGYHFADGKARTVLCHQAAAGGIRKARHRAEHRPVGQGDIADLQRFHGFSLYLFWGRRF